MSEPRAITSLTNERVKFIRALEMRKVRRETGLFVAEGVSILVSAHEKGVTPQILAYQTQSATSGAARALLETALRSGAECLEVTPAILEKLAARENPQTMLGVFAQRWSEPPRGAELKASELWLVLEEVRDPGNLGTIIRSVDAFGASGIILVGSCADPYSREAVRATMGSIFAVPLVALSREDFLAWRADWPGDVIATHLGAREDVRKVVARGPALLVMGSEGPGLSPEMTAAATRGVKIPMAGRIDSLNLAIATGIALFELRRPYLEL